MAKKAKRDSSRVGNRKLSAFVLSLIVLGLLASLGHLTETVMWSLIGLYGAFAGGNVGEHITSALKVRSQNGTVLSRDSGSNQETADE